MKAISVLSRSSPAKEVWDLLPYPDDSFAKVNAHTGDKLEPAAPKQFGPSELVWKMRRHLHQKDFNFNFVTIYLSNISFRYFK